MGLELDGPGCGSDDTETSGSSSSTPVGDWEVRERFLTGQFSKCVSKRFGLSDTALLHARQTMHCRPSTCFWMNSILMDDVGRPTALPVIFRQSGSRD